MTKRVVRDAGVPTADFAVIEKRGRHRQGRAAFPLFLKPVAEGSGKGVDARSKVDDRAELDSVARRSAGTIPPAGAGGEFLPGREFTVGITGTGEDAAVLGVSEIVPNANYVGDGYGYREQGGLGRQARHRAAPTTPRREAAGEVALAAWRALRCRDGGRVDIRCDADGKPHFIEVNPLAGIRPGYSDLCFIADSRRPLLSAADRQIPGIAFLARHPGAHNENPGAAFRRRRRTRRPRNWTR